MIEFMFLEELMLIKQVQQKSVIFVTIITFQRKASSFNHMYAIYAIILNIKGADYGCINSGINKSH